jgi:energy-coupling factor transport system ATP-binding protein
MQKTVLEVKDLKFRYSEMKRNVFEGINFEVKEGEFFCIIGSNGSGKSTLCSALVGLIPYYFTGRFSGDVVVQGVNTNESSIAKLSADIGLVFQNPFNQLSYTTGSVAEELAYGLGNKGVPRTEMLKKVEAVAKLMRIDHIIDKNPLELSGGQVQRVAFGSTFVMEPQILVLDECTTQLDPMGSEEIFDIVKDLNKNGITVVMVDHDMERVARCADRVMVMDDGKQIAVDTPEKIFGNPELLKHRIGIPDYVKICEALAERGAYKGMMQVEESLTIEVVKEALAI